MKRSGPMRRSKAIRRSAPASADVRRKILRRDGHRCRRCRWKPRELNATSLRWLHVHHLLARSQGGGDDNSNLATLCWRCHDGVHGHALPDWQRWIRRRRDPGAPQPQGD